MQFPSSYLDVGRQGSHAQLEAHLVIALARGAVTDEGGIGVDSGLNNT